MTIRNVVAATLIMGTVLLGGPIDAFGQEVPVIECRMVMTAPGVHDVDCRNIQAPMRTQVDVDKKAVSPQTTLPRASSTIQMSYSKYSKYSKLPKDLPDMVRKLIGNVADTLGLNPRLVEAVAMAESGGNQGAVSPVGAIGVMQLMPGTARGLGVNPRNLEENIWGGGMYLKQQLDRQQGNVPLALAAYNAGPGAVQKFQGIPPYPETRQYISRVLSIMGRS